MRLNLNVMPHYISDLFSRSIKNETDLIFVSILRLTASWVGTVSDRDKG